MGALDAVLERRLAGLSQPLALVLPGGQRLGPATAAVTLRLRSLATLAHLATGHIGRIGADYVEGRLEIEGTPRDLMTIAGQLAGDPREAATPLAAPAGWRALWQRLRSRAHHDPGADARQVQFHYDVSDDFYALWLDPRRIYSCAYYRDRTMTLAKAQEAKLDHICRKLMLREGELLLDMGAGWGGLLLWAAEHYGVRGTGITLSRHQHEHANQLVRQRGLQGRISMRLLDYRALPEDEPFDKIASVGMFEHVGMAQLPAYFAKIRRLLKPGGLLMNHGITAGGTRHHQLGAGVGDFIERYVFPGGELVHASRVLELMAEQGLEALDVENLRPHYARTLWAWSDRLEARLDEARRIAGERVVRAYRLYLAGSAMGFERGWMALHQMLAARPDGNPAGGAFAGAQSVYPFNRAYMYANAPDA